MKKRSSITAAVSLFLILSVNAFAQTGNGALTGTVEDPTKALIPGVTITATNTQTGIATAVLSNESGGYNIPGLLPGVYGISAAYVNTTVNGQSVQDGRYAAGIYSTTRINPDLVGEVRLVLTPVDAELGRGNGQVQIQTRSGTNQFRGSAVWDARNSALDARSWIDNRTVPKPARNWTNQHQYTLSYGGPIVKNRTFFFVLFDGQRTRLRQSVNASVLTPCARNGIFRYFPDWNNGNINQNPTAVPTALGTAARPVVDAAGNPQAPATFRNGTPYTGTLQYLSVFGRLLNTPTRPDCSDAQIAPNTAWDSNRTTASCRLSRPTFRAPYSDTTPSPRTSSPPILSSTPSV